MRGACSSAYVVTVKPAGTVGRTPSGFGTLRPAFGVPVPGAGRVSAFGCGTVEFCCATSPTADSAASDATNSVRFINAPSGGPAEGRTLHAFQRIIVVRNRGRLLMSRLIALTISLSLVVASLCCYLPAQFGGIGIRFGLRDTAQ